LRQIPQLRFRNACFPADGRVEINSKGAADHGCRFQLR
jgi:hypothetical protein